MSSPRLRLGTRGSMLALAQADLLRQELLKAYDGDIEMVVIKTQGDQQTEKPLWQLDGKNFFTKELDEALLKDEVDFVVHSLKDLGSERPSGLELLLVPPRIYPQDIVLFPRNLTPKKELVIGTSSPRRIENLTSSLNEYFPFEVDKITCKNLRGNVDTRIRKLIEGEYDGICLAMAGLERLSRYPEHQEKIQNWFKELRFMVLPIKDFPPATAQGALGVEVSQTGKHFDLLEKLFDPFKCSQTSKNVQHELQRFQEFGGGCHLSVGIHVRTSSVGLVKFEKGKWDNQPVLEGRRLKSPQIPETKLEAFFLGLPQVPKSWPLIDRVECVGDEYVQKRGLPYSHEKVDRGVHHFISSRYVIEQWPHFSKLQFSNHPLFWAAGQRAWKALSKKGFPVQACADGFGISEIEYLSGSKLLNLAENASTHTIVLWTHKHSPTEHEKEVGYERIKLSPQEDYFKKLERPMMFYWTSFSQFKDFKEKVNFHASSLHFCGLGKTYQQFKDWNAEFKMEALASMNELKTVYKKVFS